MHLLAITLGLAIQTTSEIDKLIGDLYAVISGPAGKKRDWDAFRDLFDSESQMRIVAKQNGKPNVFVFTPDTYVKQSGPLLESRGFFEKEVSRKMWVYGDLAQIWSTYESRNKEDDQRPFMRGINAMTLGKKGDKWKVLSITWTDENSAGPIPKEFLPGGG